LQLGDTDLYCYSEPFLTSGKLCFIMNFIGGHRGQNFYWGGAAPWPPPPLNRPCFPLISASLVRHSLLHFLLSHMAFHHLHYLHHQSLHLLYSYSLSVSLETQDLALRQILSSIDLFLSYRTDYTDSRTT